MIPALHLAGARLAGRGRSYERELGDRFEGVPYKGVLAGSGGPGDDDQASSSHPRALIKRSRWPWVSPTRVLERLTPASLMIRVTFIRPMPLMATAIKEVAARDEFDYEIVNGAREQARTDMIETLQKIVAGGDDSARS